MTTTKKKSSTLEEGVTTIDVAYTIHNEVVDGIKRRRKVLLVGIPVCPGTKLGLDDTVDAYLGSLGCVADVVRSSNTEIAVAPYPGESFDEEQVGAIVRHVASFRELDADKFRVCKHAAKSPVARKLRYSFAKELPKALGRAGAGAMTLQLTTSGGSG